MEELFFFFGHGILGGPWGELFLPSPESCQEGDKVEGLRISKIDGDKVEVTTRPLAHAPESIHSACGRRKKNIRNLSTVVVIGEDMPTALLETNQANPHHLVCEPITLSVQN